MEPFDFAPIPHSMAKPFIELWHYSHKCPKGSNVFFGAFIDHELYAVANYGVGVNMDKGKSLIEAAAKKGLGRLPITENNLLELKRLCRVGDKGEARIHLTQFISHCHKVLRRWGTRFIVSYADPTEGQTRIPTERQQRFAELGTYACGFVYQAAGFKHLGHTQREVHFVDADGKFVHRRVPYRAMRRYNDPLGLTSGKDGKHPDPGAKTMTIVQEEMGLKRSKDAGRKDRWFMDLGVWQPPATRPEKRFQTREEFQQWRMQNENDRG